MKPAPVALNLVRPGLERLAGQRLRDDRGILWLDGDRLEAGLARADDLDTAGDGAAGADGGDEDIHLAARYRPRFLPPWSGGGSSGLAGFSNCCGIHELGVFCRSSSARAMAPFMPSAPGVRTSFAPSMASSVRRSSDIVSGMVRMSLYPRAAATKARAMPVLPLVGSMITVSG